MQPDNSPESLVVITLLESTDECLFDSTPSSPRLSPIFFNAHTTLEHERDCHFFVGDITCSRWKILVG